MKNIKLMMAFVLGVITGGIGYAQFVGIFHQNIETPQPAKQVQAIMQGKNSTPISQPRFTRQEIMRWAPMTAADTLSFNFDNHEKMFELAKVHFDEAAWKNFEENIKKKRIIERVQANYLTVRAEPKSVPRILSQGEENGAYQWVIEVTLFVGFQLQERTYNESVTIVMTIQQSDDTRYPDGLVITKWDGGFE